MPSKSIGPTIAFRAAACEPCPPEGVDCSVSSAITLMPGFYRPDDDDSTPYRCPLVDSCPGGLVSGNTSCKVGNTGALCGTTPAAAASPGAAAFAAAAVAATPCRRRGR